MENKQFFDPYNFNNGLSMQNHNIHNNQIIDDTMLPQMMQPNPSMFYEQQYWYYNYLTKMLEYKIKLKEYENMNKKQN